MVTESKGLASVRALLRENLTLAHLLGLCPLLAVTTTTLNGLLLGVATMSCLTLSCVVASALRKVVARETRLLVFVVIIAGVVSVADLLLETFFYASHLTLGLFVPLIVTNCAILASIEAFAVRANVSAAAIGGLARGAGLAGVLIVIGLLREVVGFGAPSSLLGQPSGASSVAQSEVVFQLALLPPGAFFALALLLVAFRWASERGKRSSVSNTDVQALRIERH